MSYRINQAINTYNLEVQDEAIQLIEIGVPPFDAILQARSIVERRRRQKEGAQNMSPFIQNK